MAALSQRGIEGAGASRPAWRRHGLEQGAWHGHRCSSPARSAVPLHIFQPASTAAIFTLSGLGQYEAARRELRFQHRRQGLEHRCPCHAPCSRPCLRHAGRDAPAPSMPRWSERRHDGVIDLEHDGGGGIAGIIHLPFDGGERIPRVERLQDPPARRHRCPAALPPACSRPPEPGSRHDRRDRERSPLAAALAYQFLEGNALPLALEHQRCAIVSGRVIRKRHDRFEIEFEAMADSRP